MPSFTSTPHHSSIHAVGIIAEYNPFHLGHAYQLQEAKSRSHATHVIVVMSGDFVQRGAPALLDKYTRTQMALSCGADLVLEIPNAFAVSSAEDFASCGVSLLDKLGVVSSLCFGSEEGEIEPFIKIASLLSEESSEYSSALQSALKSGLSFPTARKEALSTILNHSQDKDSLLSLLHTPNNILAIEYCKAIQKRKSPIQPLTIRREGMGYHESSPFAVSNSVFPSATSIRNLLLSMQTAKMEQTTPSPISSTLHDSLQHAVPPEVLPLLLEGFPIFTDDMTLPLNYALLSLQQQGIAYSVFSDVSKELNERLKHCLFTPVSFEERIAQLKTRQYTYTRISRALIHILLGIQEADVMSWKSPSVDYAPYARVLGFRKDAALLLRAIKNTSSIPLLTQPKNAEQFLSHEAVSLLRQDIFASHFYQSVLSSKYHIPAKNEFQAGHSLLGYSVKGSS